MTASANVAFFPRPFKPNFLFRGQEQKQTRRKKGGKRERTSGVNASLFASLFFLTEVGDFFVCSGATVNKLEPC